MLFRTILLAAFVVAVIATLILFEAFGYQDLFKDIAVEIGGALLVAAATFFLIKPFRAHDAARKLRINHSQLHGIFVSTKPKHLNSAFVTHFADMARLLNSTHENKSAQALFLDYDAALKSLRDRFEAEVPPVYNAEGVRELFNKTNEALLLVIKKLSWPEGRKFERLIDRLTVRAGPNAPLRPSEVEKLFSYSEDRLEFEQSFGQH
jgi:hypothetical protein